MSDRTRSATAFWDSDAIHRSNFAQERLDQRPGAEVHDLGLSAGRRLHAAERDNACMTERIQFYFDPMCPYAYQTSVWIRDVREQVGLDITWRFFSLEEVNRVEGKKHPWERPWSFGWGQMRVGSLIRRELGNDELDRWYAAVGSAFFNDGVKTHVPEVHAEVLRRQRVRPDARRAARSPTRRTIDDVRADHDVRGVDLRRARRADDRRSSRATRCTDRSSCPRRRATTRSRSGSSCASCALPAPVRAAPPEDARRSRARREQFETYLTTRDWNTVENPAP